MRRRTTGVPTISPPTPEATGIPTSSPSPDPSLLMTVAGGGKELGDRGPATSAGICGPNDVAIEGAGNVYISDAGLYCRGPGGHRVRKVDPNGMITTVAGTGERGYSGDGGPATAAGLFRCCPPVTGFPGGLALDAEGNLYVADGEAAHERGGH
jgi:hypothetical protein